jgi:hypothetical protein
VKGHQYKSPQPWNILTTIKIHVDQLTTDMNKIWEKGEFSQEYSYIAGEAWQIFKGQINYTKT